MSALIRASIVLVAVLLLGCGGDGEEPPPAATPTVPAVETPVATLTPTVVASASPTATPEPSPTPSVVRRDIQATRLVVPALGLDAPVQAAPTVPYVYVPAPGCPPGPDDSETVTVPDQGIATPADNLEGLENKAWIYGHSRWLGVPGLFLGLQDLDVGDELFIDGVDRESGAAIAGERYVVDGFYLADIDSGDDLLTSEEASEIPSEPIVVLQTSVRERGAGSAWILDRETLLSKAENIVEGDLDDPCKYLLLFVTASPA